MPVAKMLTGIWTSSFGYFHDDYLLSFDPKTPHEYLYWSEQEFRLNASLVHMYWHAHHKYATSANPSSLSMWPSWASRLAEHTRRVLQVHARASFAWVPSHLHVASTKIGVAV
jgi:hypothetical protein